MDALFEQFAQTRSQDAFRQLVERHIDAVYSQARRMLSDAALAEDVTQGVFLMLWQSGKRVRRGVVLASWLHRTTRYACLNARRSRARRQKHEQRAAAMRNMWQPVEQPECPWNEIEPALDEAIAQLNGEDRDAILLRFFGGVSMRELGAALSVSEDAARQRVSRALEKLRHIFAQRGVVAPSSGALAMILEANAVQAAPAGLAGSAVAVAVAPASATRLLAGQTSRLMTWNAAKVAAFAIVSALAITGAIAISVSQLRAAPSAASTASAPTTQPATQPAVADALCEWARSVKESRLPAAREMFLADDPADLDLYYSLTQFESAAYRIVRVWDARWHVPFDPQGYQLFAFPPLRGGYAVLIERALESPATHEIVQEASHATFRIKLERGTVGAPGAINDRWGQGLIHLGWHDGKWKIDATRSMTANMSITTGAGRVNDPRARRSLATKFEEVLASEFHKLCDEIEAGVVGTQEQALERFWQGCSRASEQAGGITRISINVMPRQ